MEEILAYAATYLAIIVILIVHEYGHYRAMIASGMKVDVFSIGFGTRLFGWRSPLGTDFRFCAIPLVGYVQPAPGAFDKVSPSTAQWISFSGPLWNAHLAFVVGLVCTYGFGTSFDVIAPYVQWAPHALQPLAQSLLVSYGLLLFAPFYILYLVCQQGTEFFGNMLGPIGTVKVGVQSTVAASAGPGLLGALFKGWLRYVIMVSVSIGGFNLLPLFPLDGGHIVVYFMRRASPKFASRFEKPFKVVTSIVMLIFVAVVLASDFRSVMGF